MNRREFLQRMMAAGLVATAPKIIFDYGANSFRNNIGTEGCIPNVNRVTDLYTVEWSTPGYFHQEIVAVAGYFVTSAEIGLQPEYSEEIYMEICLPPSLA